MKDRRGKHRFLQALIADPYRKLASVALAIGLWYFIDTQISQDYPVTAALRHVNQSARSPGVTTPGNTLEVLLPTSKVAVLGFVDPKTQERINEVRLVFSGPKYLIDNLKGGRQLILSAGPFPGRLWQNAEVVEFTAASIARTDRVLHELRIAMQPAVVQVLIEPKHNRQFTLSKENVELQFRTAEDAQNLLPRLRWEGAEFHQEQVTVIGPKNRLDRFPADPATRPFQALVAPINAERQVSGNVNLNLPADDVDMELDVITTVTIPLLPKQEQYRVEIPIYVDDLSLPQSLQGRYQPSQPSMEVNISVSGQLKTILGNLEDGEPRKKWARENLRLDVWIQPREKEQDFGAELTVEARLQPVGPLRDQVDPIHYSLAQTAAVKLVKSNK